LQLLRKCALKRGTPLESENLTYTTLSSCALQTSTVTIDLNVLTVYVLQKRQLYEASKVKKVGRHFYATANVKNRTGR